MVETIHVLFNNGASFEKWEFLKNEVVENADHGCYEHNSMSVLFHCRSNHFDTCSIFLELPFFSWHTLKRKIASVSNFYHFIQKAREKAVLYQDIAYIEYVGLSSTTLIGSFSFRHLKQYRCTTSAQKKMGICAIST